MEIITIKPKVKVNGFVDIKVYDQEDLAKMEPKVHQYGRNTIHDNLLGKLIDAMDGSQPSTTNYHITTSSSWFDSHLAIASAGNNSTNTDRHNQDGIVAHGDQATGTLDNTDSNEAPEDVPHFFLNTVNASGGGTSVSTDTCTWTAQATWDQGSSNTISKLGIGNSYNVNNTMTTNANGDPEVSFDIIFATYDPTDFAVANNDVLKVSWSIQIGG